MKFVVSTVLAVFLALAATAGRAPAAAAERSIALPSPERVKLRTFLAKRRALQIQRLVAYRRARVFPRNRISQSVINVFRDERGLLCAIANLVYLDGRLGLVEKTAKENNTVKMGTLESGPLYDWILTSGLTQEEIAFAQLPDMPVGPGPDWIERENERIVAHLEAVEKKLEENTAASLTIAVNRLMKAGIPAA